VSACLQPRMRKEWLFNFTLQMGSAEHQPGRSDSWEPLYQFDRSYRCARLSWRAVGFVSWYLMRRRSAVDGGDKTCH